MNIKLRNNNTNIGCEGRTLITKVGMSTVI